MTILNSKFKCHHIEGRGRPKCFHKGIILIVNCDNCNKYSTMMTSVKAVKNQSKTIVQIDKAAYDFYSAALSRIRQPIEALFIWFIEKTDFPRASKV